MKSNLFSPFYWLTKSSVQLPDVENEQWVVADEHDVDDDDDEIDGDNNERFRYNCWINSLVISDELVKNG